MRLPRLLALRLRPLLTRLPRRLVDRLMVCSSFRPTASLVANFRLLAFNAAFGITTDFAAVPAVDDQGNIIAGTGSSSAAASSAATATAASASAAVATTANAAVASSSSTASSSSIGDFGSCTVPQIQFATGFDNRKETSFEPVDQSTWSFFATSGIKSDVSSI